MCWNWPICIKCDSVSKHLLVAILIAFEKHHGLSGLGIFKLDFKFAGFQAVHGLALWIAIIQAKVDWVQPADECRPLHQARNDLKF
jgi:hypothetical protein